MKSMSKDFCKKIIIKTKLDLLKNYTIMDLF